MTDKDQTRKVTAVQKACLIWNQPVAIPVKDIVFTAVMVSAAFISSVGWTWFFAITATAMALNLAATVILNRKQTK